MSILPQESRVLVQPDKDKEEKTEGGLYKPQTVENNVQKGTVVAVGEGQWLATGTGLARKPMNIEKGDRVIIRRGTGLDLDGLLLLEDYEVLALEVE